MEPNYSVYNGDFRPPNCSYAYNNKEKNMRYFLAIALLGLSISASAAEQTMSAVGDSKKEACESAEWEARKACVRLGRGGLPVSGAQCASCSEHGAYQFQCTVVYRCK